MSASRHVPGGDGEGRLKMNGTRITSSSCFNDTLPQELGQGDGSPLPADSLMRPEQVVTDPRFDQAEKRGLLASWASDVRAVPIAPELRQLDNGAIVCLGDILRALRSLDRGKDSKQTRWHPHRSSGSRVRFPGGLRSALQRGRSDDDDDDPPPCPAMIFRPVGGPLLGGSAAEIGVAV